jgi:hypothetical protein
MFAFVATFFVHSLRAPHINSIAPHHPQDGQQTIEGYERGGTNGSNPSVSIRKVQRTHVKRISAFIGRWPKFPNNPQSLVVLVTSIWTPLHKILLHAISEGDISCISDSSCMCFRQLYEEVTLCGSFRF